MEKLWPHDEGRVLSSTQTYESNAKLFGSFLWATLLAVVAVFILIGDQLRIPRPEQAVSLLNVVGVVLVVLFTWPLLYRLLSGRRQ
jgi:NhaP-type Na+/H+ or K+/H+ antiporter